MVGVLVGLTVGVGVGVRVKVTTGGVGADGDWNKGDFGSWGLLLPVGASSHKKGIEASRQPDSKSARKPNAVFLLKKLDRLNFIMPLKTNGLSLGQR